MPNWEVVGVDICGNEKRLKVLAATQQEAASLAKARGFAVGEVKRITETSAGSHGPTTCANCERVIGKLEVLQVWQQQPVCRECYDRLSAQSRASAELPYAAPSPTNVPRLASGRLCSCGAMVAPNADRCPHCGRRFTHITTWMVAFIVLIFFLFIIVKMIAVA